MIIKITQEHITNGKKGDCTKCALALALKDATGITWSTGVHGIWPHLRPGTPFKEAYVNNEQLYRFTEAFDKGETVKPFEFNLNDLKEWTFNQGGN